uniref:Uncharacterized protein n=1 Tax=viral metagenome TaxID=1070528 RepID=A0A6C0JIC9_9ZZZZ
MALTEGLKFKYSLYTTLLFFLLGSPTSFRVSNRLFGGTVSSKGGCPTAVGFALHTFVFLVGLYGLMSLPHDEKLTMPLAPADFQAPPPEMAPLPGSDPST